MANIKNNFKYTINRNHSSNKLQAATRRLTSEETSANIDKIINDFSKNLNKELNEGVLFQTNNVKKKEIFEVIHNALNGVDENSGDTTLNTQDLKDLIVSCKKLERDRAKNQGGESFQGYIKLARYTFESLLSLKEGKAPSDKIKTDFSKKVDKLANQKGLSTFKKFLIALGLIGGTGGYFATAESHSMASKTHVFTAIKFIKGVAATVGKALAVVAAKVGLGVLAGSGVGFAAAVGLGAAGAGIYFAHRHYKEEKALSRLNQKFSEDINSNPAAASNQQSNRQTGPVNIANIVYDPNREDPAPIPDDTASEPKTTLTTQDIERINPALLRPLRGNMNEIINQHKTIATDMHALIQGLERVAKEETNPDIRAKLEPILLILQTGSKEHQFIELITTNHLPEDESGKPEVDPMETFKKLCKIINTTEYQTALHTLFMIALFCAKGRLLDRSSYNSSKLKHQHSDRNFYTTSKTTSGVDISENKSLVDLLSSSMQCLTRLALLTGELSNIAIATKDESFIENAAYINKEYRDYLNKAQAGAPVNPASRKQNEMQLNAARIESYKLDIERKIGEALPETAEIKAADALKQEADKLRKILNFGFVEINNAAAIGLLAPPIHQQPLETLGLCAINIDAAISRGLQRKEDLINLSLDQLISIREEIIKVESSTNNLQFYFRTPEGLETRRKMAELLNHIDTEIKNKMGTVQNQLNAEKSFDENKIKYYLTLNVKSNTVINSLLDFSKIIEDKELCNSISPNTRVELVHHFMLQKVLSAVNNEQANGKILGEDDFGNICHEIKVKYLSNINYDKAYFAKEVVEDINFLLEQSRDQNNYIYKTGSFIPVNRIKMDDGEERYLPVVTMVYAMELCA